MPCTRIHSWIEKELEALHIKIGPILVSTVTIVRRLEPPMRQTRRITTVPDRLAERELGAPPIDYAFVAVGSQGRREMALASEGVEPRST